MNREVHVRFWESAGLQCLALLAHLKAYADGREARAGIGSWMTFYNFRRPHQAMNNQMPMAVWRAGMDKIAAARAVDMPLRLDNANALPTYPQQKQKQQEAA
jgi:putative transposase